MPTVALGDFNDWFWAGSVRRSGAGAAGPDAAPHLSVGCPLFQLDRVYSGREALLGSHTDAAARAISDHRPVISDIRL